MENFNSFLDDSEYLKFISDSNSLLVDEEESSTEEASISKKRINQFVDNKLDKKTGKRGFVKSK